MARELGFVVLAIALVWPLIYFLLPAAGYELKLWALLVIASISAIYAGMLVFIGETIIEDIIKTVLFLILTGITWFIQPRAGFLFICALSAGVIGTLLNHIQRVTRK